MIYYKFYNFYHANIYIFTILITNFKRYVSIICMILQWQLILFQYSSYNFVNVFGLRQKRYLFIPFTLLYFQVHSVSDSNNYQGQSNNYHNSVPLYSFIILSIKLHSNFGYSSRILLEKVRSFYCYFVEPSRGIVI